MYVCVREVAGGGDKLTVHVHTHTQGGQSQFQHAMGVIFRRFMMFCHSRLANRPASSMMGVCLLYLVFIMGAPSVFSRTWTGRRAQVLAQDATKMDIAETQDHATCRKQLAAQTCLKDVCAMQGLRATALRDVSRVPLARIRQGAATRRARTVAPGNTPPRVGRRPVSVTQGLGGVSLHAPLSFPVPVAIQVQMANAPYARLERSSRAKAAPLVVVALRILTLVAAVSVRPTAHVMQASQRY